MLSNNYTNYRPTGHPSGTVRADVHDSQGLYVRTTVVAVCGTIQGAHNFAKAENSRNKNQPKIKENNDDK